MLGKDFFEFSLCKFWQYGSKLKSKRIETFISWLTHRVDFFPRKNKCTLFLNSAVQNMYSRWKIIPEVVGQKGGAHEILNFQFNVRELCLKGNAKLRLVAWAMSVLGSYMVYSYSTYIFPRVCELNLIWGTFCPSTGLRNSFIPFCCNWKSIKKNRRVCH